MTEEEKTAELDKIVSLVKQLVDAVDTKPPKMHEAGLTYSDIRHWYHAYKNKEKNVS
jgi:hypothetical protein